MRSPLVVLVLVVPLSAQGQETREWRPPPAVYTEIARYSPAVIEVAEATTGCLEHSHGCFATTQGYFGSQAAARKSPVLAGALSFLVPFGTGSFYAGNSGHGVRHLVIGGVALSGMVVSAVSMPDLCDAACTEFGVFMVSFGVFFLNQVVGTIVAVIDANHFNRDLGSAAFSVSPTFTVVGREASGNGIGTMPTEQLGVRLLHFSF